MWILISSAINCNAWLYCDDPTKHARHSSHGSLVVRVLRNLFESLLPSLFSLQWRTQTQTRTQKNGFLGSSLYIIQGRTIRPITLRYSPLNAWLRRHLVKAGRNPFRPRKSALLKSLFSPRNQRSLVFRINFPRFFSQSKYCKSDGYFFRPRIFFSELFREIRIWNELGFLSDLKFNFFSES